jgi:nitrogen-specific signal transduction histidine kinase
MGVLLNWMIILRGLYKPFLFKNDLPVHFSKISKMIKKKLDLTHAVLLFRDEEGFKSPLPKEKFEISEKSIEFRDLIKKNKILIVRSMDRRKIRSVYWPISIDGECVACYLFGLKSKEIRLSNEKKFLMKLLADRLVDLWSRKLLWEKLQTTNRQDIFGWMSAAMVHEIRNPLTALDTIIQLLPQKRGDAFFMDSFQKLMQREISRLSDLTNDFLDFSVGGLEKIALVDLKEIIQQVTQLMGPLFYSKKIRLKVKAPKRLFLSGDKTQIKSLFINLLQNALKAIQSEGVVEISTRFLVKSPYGSNWLEIQVKDNGSGISKENMDKIFMPFFSADRLGTGLGLAICQKITEDHKGYIKVKSQLGKGTVFAIYFPSTPIPKKIKTLPF